jgi:ring-1,2-phenylacetyl-CoA epoxidase subunit PaaD
VSLASSTPVTQARCEQAWTVLAGVLDPEVPALSVCDLGLVRDVQVDGAGTLAVVLTPTYSGCPATELIEQQVIEAVEQAGLGPARVEMRRAPAWTSDWISEEGRRKLREYGIAPPHLATQDSAPVRFVNRRVMDEPAVDCPHCASPQTTRVSAFGSTACKSLHRCLSCMEPFEYFKPI